MQILRAFTFSIQIHESAFEMTVRPEDIHAFPTAFGHDLLAEVPNFVATPYLVVTMEDLWPHLKDRFAKDIEVYFVRSMERADLEADLPKTAHFSSFIGLGGGQAVDAAKYFAWRHNAKLHQFPTSLSVDAMYGQRAGVRENQIVRYVGWAIPECVYFDYDILSAAPKHINRAGIGDVFCFFTGAWDWEYAHRTGKAEAKWPYDAGLAQHSLKLAEAALVGKDAIRDMTPEGIQLIVDAFKWGGASFHGAGWCPRHIEGVEHFIFYALEARTGVKFLHGQAVCLGLVAGAMMHDRRAAELRSAVRDIGVDIRPESMGITWDDVDASLRGLSRFVRDVGLPYGIAHDFEVTDDFLLRLRQMVDGNG
ncbi:MAG: iron-containing alcohol dehydrogenase [Rhodobacteraceae bacterium]|nr:iron-containing alcohol dehydrogenase [Paracoccaceae bacterium]